MRFPDEKVKILWRDTYLATIKNSVGTKIFRSIFAIVKGKKEDILRNGDLSCAVFVSTLLTFAQLLDRPRTTALSTEKTMQKLGWIKIARPRVGAVIVWEKKMGASGKGHRHIGFSLGGKKAISNSPERSELRNSLPIIFSNNAKETDGRESSVLFSNNAVSQHCRIFGFLSNREG